MNIVQALHFLAPVIGVVALLIGFAAMFLPTAMSKKFGIAATGSAASYVVSVGVRDVFMGIAVLVLYFQQQWFSLGLIQFAIALVAVSDCWMVYKQGDKRISLVHLSGALIAGAYGAFLIS